jgi:hypothetical protein
LEELERHQEAFHKWICRTPIRDRSMEKGKGKEELPKGFVGGRGGGEWRQCEKAFPDERLLILVSCSYDLIGI